LTGIQAFPNFVPINDTIKDQVYAHASQYPHYSDFNYVNMLAWDLNQQTVVSVLRGNLVVRMSDYLTDERFYSFLGNIETAETTTELLNIAEQESAGRKLCLVPEIGVHALKASELFAVTEDTAAHDYVISIPDVAAATGKKFQNVRQAVGYFDSLYGEVARFEDLDLTQLDNQNEILEVFWTREGYKSEQGHGNQAENELLAIHRLFQHVDLDLVRGYGLRVHDKLAAFMIYEPHSVAWSTAHFCKANTEHKGIFRSFIHSVAQDLETQGAVYMNLEQDLGIGGLKTMKRSLNPVEMLKKYTVTDAS
jgi:hypothetical protein